MIGQKCRMRNATVKHVAPNRSKLPVAKTCTDIIHAVVIKKYKLMSYVVCTITSVVKLSDPCLYN